MKMTETYDGEQRFAQARGMDITAVARTLDIQLHSPGGRAASMVGPCPLGCASTDGFVVYTDQNRFWCRKGKHGGTSVDLVMMVRGCDATSAVNFLLGATMPPAPQTPRTAPARQPSAQETGAALAEMAGKVNRRNGAVIGAAYAQQHREYLLSRGLTMDTWKAFKLGSGGDHSLAIPWIDSNGNLLAVKHRRIDNQDGARYWWEKGIFPKGKLFGAHMLNESTAQTLMIVEGEINCMSISQSVDCGADVLSTGSDTTKPPDPRHFSQWKQLIVWMDTEAKARQWAIALHGTPFWLDADANDLLVAGELDDVLERLKVL